MTDYMSKPKKGGAIGKAARFMPIVHRGDLTMHILGGQARPAPAFNALAAAAPVLGGGGPGPGPAAGPGPGPAPGPGPGPGPLLPAAAATPASIEDEYPPDFDDYVAPAEQAQPSIAAGAGVPAFNALAAARVEAEPQRRPYDLPSVTATATAASVPISNAAGPHAAAAFSSYSVSSAATSATPAPSAISVRSPVAAESLSEPLPSESEWVWPDEGSWDASPAPRRQGAPAASMAATTAFAAGPHPLAPAPPAASAAATHAHVSNLLGAIANPTNDRHHQYFGVQSQADIAMINSGNEATVELLNQVQSHRGKTNASGREQLVHHAAAAHVLRGGVCDNYAAAAAMHARLSGHPHVRTVGVAGHKVAAVGQEEVDPWRDFVHAGRRADPPHPTDTDLSSVSPNALQAEYDAEVTASRASLDHVLSQPENAGHAAAYNALLEKKRAGYGNHAERVKAAAARAAETAAVLARKKERDERKAQPSAPASAPAAPRAASAAPSAAGQSSAAAKK